MGNSRELIRLSKVDNVLVACRDLQEGENIVFEGITFDIGQFVGLGHKIAATDIEAGEPIVKYNVVIGSALSKIKKGEHVHVHNMKSNYISTYTFGENTN